MGKTLADIAQSLYRGISTAAIATAATAMIAAGCGAPQKRVRQQATIDVPDTMACDRSVTSPYGYTGPIKIGDTDAELTIPPGAKRTDEIAVKGGSYGVVGYCVYTHVVEKRASSTGIEEDTRTLDTPAQVLIIQDFSSGAYYAAAAYKKTEIKAVRIVSGQSTLAIPVVADGKDDVVIVQANIHDGIVDIGQVVDAELRQPIVTQQLARKKRKQPDEPSAPAPAVKQTPLVPTTPAQDAGSVTLASDKDLNGDGKPDYQYTFPVTAGGKTIDAMLTYSSDGSVQTSPEIKLVEVPQPLPNKGTLFVLESDGGLYSYTTDSSGRPAQLKRHTPEADGRYVLDDFLVDPKADDKMQPLPPAAARVIVPVTPGKHTYQQAVDAVYKQQCPMVQKRPCSRFYGALVEDTRETYKITNLDQPIPAEDAPNGEIQLLGYVQWAAARPEEASLESQVGSDQSQDETEPRTVTIPTPEEAAKLADKQPSTLPANGQRKKGQGKKGDTDDGTPFYKNPWLWGGTAAAVGGVVLYFLLSGNGDGAFDLDHNDDPMDRYNLK